MKKTWITLGLSAALLAGCGGGEEKTTDTAKENEPAKETAAFPVTVTGADNQKVEIEAAPKRIVTLAPSNTEIVYELGLGEEVVGVSDNDTYPEDVKNKEKVGGMEFNVEKIISLKPDLVLAHDSAGAAAETGIQQLRDAGIDVLVINNAASIDEMYQSFELIGEATGTTAEAETEVKELKAGFADLEEKASSIKEENEKSVFFEVDPTLYTAGNGTFLNEIFDMLHINNTMADQEGWPQVTEEAVIEKNPDVILLNYGGYVENAVNGVLKREGWSNVNAVKNKEVFEVNADLTSRTGPRLVEGAEAIAEAVYPDVFAQ
ncbi:ABC transporter substrate-binding protein [Domibacillus sp. DTU_2020_1001157_1_SI_ALB_TIR_016]|uniref:ABC transporter substrate-binding protein n=1 Tax=Domibacillus sp. DTU_2020_1001157_1_SI_ALB_TIR_016 TaxID=3077789 RepID=UPI0028EEC4CE|nr:ABC transporter substrate-binding protein [Domibacillus sp. DTU_2020_1001157_1_SI_ALB_TIR_016]WNS80248.1 ABC transporter substrate-binding protein [Domibacillus sp. DTU_2020_1001157_1_SI_ALB_TIR_016]